VKPEETREQEGSKKLKVDQPSFPHPFHDETFGICGSHICSQLPRIPFPPKPRPLEDYTMMALSGSIRSKPCWFNKMHDPKIVKKWKQEAVSQGLRPEAVDFVLQELQYYADQRQGTIEVSAVDGVWQADHHIPSEINSTYSTNKST
jgi:hypothetical protein